MRTENETMGRGNVCSAPLTPLRRRNEELNEGNKEKPKPKPTEAGRRMSVRQSGRTHLPDTLSHNQIERNPATLAQPSLIRYAPQEPVHELLAGHRVWNMADEPEVRVDWKMNSVKLVHRGMGGGGVSTPYYHPAKGLLGHRLTTLARSA